LGGQKSKRPIEKTECINVGHIEATADPAGIGRRLDMGVKRDNNSTAARLERPTTHCERLLKYKVGSNPPVVHLDNWQR